MDPPSDGKARKTIAIVISNEEPQPANTFLITTAEARLRINKLSTTIFSTKEKIMRILQARESRLQQRWAKKSKEQRIKILRAAWPEIPGRHGAGVHEILQSICPQSCKPTGYPKSDAIYKWPYLNLEDLAHGRNLPLLLNSRGRNNPDVFAYADLAACELGRENEKIKVAWLPRHLMMLNGQDRPEVYGKLTHWEESDLTAFYLWIAGVHLDVGDGLLVLEIQKKIYEFLLECCCHVFSEVPRDQLLEIRVPLQPEPALIETRGASYLNLATVVAEAPFRVPDVLDTERLLRLISAKRAAAEDHAWSIREDPGYFRDFLLSRAKHQPEHFRDSKGKKDPNLDSEAFWNEVMLEELDSTYLRLWRWDILYERAEALHTKAPEGFVNFDQQKPLPKDVEDVVLEILYVAGILAISYRKDLRVAVPVSLEGGFVCTRRHDPKARFNILIGRARNTSTDPLVVFFSHLIDCQDIALDQVGLHHIVDEIQRTIEQDPKQAKRLSSFVSTIFSDLALLANVCRVLLGVFPWASSFIRKLTNMDIPESPQDKLFGTLRESLEKGGEYPAGAAKIRLLLPITDSLRYPIHKAYNEDNVEILRRSEFNLDLFWRRWDGAFYENMGVPLTDILRRYSKVTRVINRTLPFRPPRNRKMTPSIPVYQPSNIATLVLEPEVPRRFTRETPRVKTKTRKGQTASSESTDIPDKSSGTSEVNASDSCFGGPMVKFKLKERALTVFRSMFYARSITDQRREVPWKDFLHAMTKVGFAAEKLYGSVWQFSPQGTEASRSFQVHQPHPANEIPHVMARNIGRRLTHTYGWTGEDFGEI